MYRDNGTNFLGAVMELEQVEENLARLTKIPQLGRVLSVQNSIKNVMSKFPLFVV